MSTTHFLLHRINKTELSETSQMKVPSQPPCNFYCSKSKSILKSNRYRTYSIERVQYGVQATGSKAQNTNEEAGNDFDAMKDRQMSRREEDFLNMTLEIKGDPFWMGTGTTISGTEVKLADVRQATVYIAFLTYRPEESVAYTENQRRGELDTAASGIYEVFKADQKLSAGQFTKHYIALETETLVRLLCKMNWRIYKRLIKQLIQLRLNM